MSAELIASAFRRSRPRLIRRSFGGATPTNYKELFIITCGPCYGVAGPYTGDDDKYFIPTECVVVAQRHEVPENERVPVVLLHQFIVDVVGGSDRFGRTTTAGTHREDLRSDPRKWYMDSKPGADLGMLRHDTVYASVTERMASRYLSSLLMSGRSTRRPPSSAHPT